MLPLLNHKKILIVVAHPDDEILGLGATMHYIHRTLQVETRVIILGEGITSRSDSRNVEHWEKELSIHKANIESARKCIGYHSLQAYDLPDNRFDSVSLLDIIKIIENEKKAFQPDVIFTHHGGDVNIDHQRTFEAVITACRPMQHETARTIITFETASGTEWRASTDPRHFIPNCFVGFEPRDLQAKLQAMECYEFEKRPFPHPRSSEALEIQAKRWGVAVGLPMAEAFCLVRQIQAI